MGERHRSSIWHYSAPWWFISVTVLSVNAEWVFSVQIKFSIFFKKKQHFFLIKSDKWMMNWKLIILSVYSKFLIKLWLNRQPVSWSPCETTSDWNTLIHCRGDGGEFSKAMIIFSLTPMKPPTTCDGLLDSTSPRLPWFINRSLYKLCSLQTMSCTRWGFFCENRSSLDVFKSFYVIICTMIVKNDCSSY